MVMGASTNPARYSYLVTQRLLMKGCEVVPFGIRKGSIASVDIINEWEAFEDIHTISMYLNPSLQIPYYDKMLSLKPRRIIFNPGTENVEFIQMAKSAGIETELACSLVMISTGEY